MARVTTAICPSVPAGWEARMKISFAVLLMVLSAAIPAHADVQLSAAEAQGELEKIYGGICGRRIPLGEYKFAVPEAAQGGAFHETALEIDAFKKIGVINIVE